MREKTKNGKKFGLKFLLFCVSVILMFGVAACTPPGPGPGDDPFDDLDGLDIRQAGKKMEITWEDTGASSYEIYRGGSRLDAQSHKIATVSSKGGVAGVSGWGYVDTTPNESKYANFYTITGGGKSQTISLEKKIFGENTYFYDAEYDDVKTIAAEINKIGDKMTPADSASQMSTERFAFYFKPGTYTGIGDLKVTFYMSVSGLGITPDLTKLGGIKSPGALGSNVTHNFWRSVENFEVTTGKFEWSVSQAAPARRINVANDCETSYYIGGWASGGFVADSYLSGAVKGGGQQQFYHRNSHFGGKGFEGVAWNKTTQGSTGVKHENNYMAGNVGLWIDETPIIREKPFLYLDTEADEYKVFVPGVEKDRVGVSWRDEEGNIVPGKGTSIGINKFYVAKSGTADPDKPDNTGADSAAKINAELAAGKHLLLQPGWFVVDEPIHVTKADTVVLGMGYASIAPGPKNGHGAMLVDDVSGVAVASVMFDAHYNSTYLIRVGDMGANKDHAEDPTLLADVFCRIGGYKNSDVNADVCVQVNSNNVIGDHLWLWLADHGRGIGWNKNTCAHGMIVSGDDVTMYGLFVEHFQKYQTIWYGEGGKTFFYQNESPYRPANQAEYMSHNGEQKGWSAYKVWNTVETHYAAGLGLYSCFHVGNITLENGAEVPNKPGIKLESVFTINIGNGGGSGTANVINFTGGSTNSGSQRVGLFENGVATTAGKDTEGTQSGDEELEIPSGPVKVAEK